MNRSLLFTGVSAAVLVALCLPPAVAQVTIHNPWIVNDRVADTHNINTMAATYVNSYQPTGVTTPANDEAKAINIYDNQKRRLYHWADEPPGPGDINDPTYNQNVFGWCLCGRHASQGCTIAKAAGLGMRKIGLPGHWVYEVQYGDGTYHTYDTMCTHYTYSRTNPRHVNSAAEIAGDNSLITAAVAEGRACPGLLLCGDDPASYASGYNSWGDYGDPGVVPSWTGSMDVRSGEVFYRCWESWANEYPTPHTDADSIVGVPDAPFHHEANKDYKDYVNIFYWEPYTLNATQNAALNIGHPISYRRWANGTDTITPDFRSAAYQALLYSSTNIATYYTDGVTPDLHANTVGTLAEAVFCVQVPYYLVDGTISGNFTRTNASDITAICTSPDGTNWTQVWNNTATGTTNLSNLSLRNQVFGNYNQFFVKVQIQATSAKTDAGVTGLNFQITYEHNKGAMAYLDNGVNHLTFTCDNISALGSGNCIKLDYKWKEFDGTAKDWTIDKAYTKYITSSPANFTIVTGGATKKSNLDGLYYPTVPRTEYIQMTIVPTPPADTTAPAAVANLACGSAGRTTMALSWTAPGNDGSTGEATGYDLRYSTSAITAGNFSSAAQVTNVPFPRPAGGAESFTVTGLTPNTTYYFAIKAYDDAGNYATISNVPSKTTMALDTQAPNAVTNLAAATTATLGTFNLTWSAPADNGNGYVATYDLRYSTGTITDANFSSATQILGLGAPQSPGTGEAFTAAGLPTGVTVYFAIKSADDSGNWSTVSNVPSAKETFGTMTFQNGLNGYAGCQDSYMSAAATTTNYEGLAYLQLCGFSDSTWTNQRRPILQFNLTSLPSSAVITQATLYVYAYANEQHDATGGYYGAYHAYHPWSASSVTWNKPWTDHGGGDTDSTPDAQAAKQTTSNVWYAFDVTSRAQAYIASPGSNNGWVIKCTDSTKHNQDDLYSCEETTDITLRPKLVITDNPVGSDTTPPAAVTNLAVSNITTSSVLLSWTAPGDDGNTGTATTYDVRYSTSAITDANFSAATQVSGVPAPQVAGTNQSVTVSGLTAGTTYCFAMKTADEVPNWSALSNVPSAATSAPTVQFSSASGSGNESVSSVNIPVTLSAASSQTVTVNYAVTGGTAVQGTDFTISGTSLTFNPGVTTQNIPVTIINDGKYGPNDTIIITLSGPTNATLGTNTTYTYTILDTDDSAPTVQFSSATGSGSESVTTVNIPVILSAASEYTTTVNYAVTGGTATGGGVDYTLNSGTLTFNPGVTSQNIVMTVVDDSIAELNETVIITLSSPTNATLGTNTTYTYTIIDNDTPAMPTFVAAGAVAYGTGAITPALPSGLQTNDILLLFIETANQTISISNQNGGTWAQVTNSPQGTGTAGASGATCLTAFWSRYNGTQGAPTTSDSGDHQIARMIAIRGAMTPGNPWDVTAGGVDATSSKSGSIPGATTTSANDLVVVAVATGLPNTNGTANFSGWTNANLSSLTERTDNTRAVGYGGGLGIATGGKATAGAYGSTTVTLANSAVKGMMSIAIMPYRQP